MPKSISKTISKKKAPINLPQIPREKWHFTAPYILDPQHPITIHVIGAGGNGSQVLNNLGRMDHTLKKLGHIGLHVTCFDDDIVTDSNMGRQLFSPADIGMNKAVALITRLNQFFGINWTAEARKYEEPLATPGVANITISCVDNIKTRVMIDGIIEKSKGHGNPYSKPYYWIDLGNAHSSGQFIIGSVGKIKQPKKSKRMQPIDRLMNVFEKYPDLKKQREGKNEPSCSLAEAISKQDLFINSSLVQLAMASLWKMFREGKINYQGAFLNLKNMDIAKISL